MFLGLTMCIACFCICICNDGDDVIVAEITCVHYQDQHGQQWLANEQHRNTREIVWIHKFQCAVTVLKRLKRNRSIQEGKLWNLINLIFNLVSRNYKLKLRWIMKKLQLMAPNSVKQESLSTTLSWRHENHIPRLEIP